MSSIHNIGQLKVDSIQRALTPISVRFHTAQGLVDEKTLRLDSLQATESVSQPFEVQLELRGDDFTRSQSRSIRDFLGRPATAEILLPDKGSGLASRNVRYFNGLVSQFTIAEDGVYRATLKPALWQMSLTNHYRVYQKKSIAETLAAVLDGHRIKYEMYLGSVATSRIQDWLQAGETDLEFMQRLMDRANIYYYFVHTSDSHVLVLANRPQYRTLMRHAGRTCKPLSLRYTFTNLTAMASQGDDLLTEYQYQQNHTTSGVDFLLARSKAAWEPDEIDRARFSSASHVSGNVTELPFQQYKVYQYGGGAREASELGTESWDKLNTSASSLSGSTTSPLLCPGHVFSTSFDATLAESPEYKYASKVYATDSRKVRANLENQPFVVTQVQHKASATELYSNTFQSTEASGLITPFNLQSTQQGTILAVVVASGGAVDPSDWRYLEKDNFAFETYGFQDRQTPEQFSGLGVYVRFITTDMQQADKNAVWVKLSQTMQTVPEVGVVVLVSRSNDDSEVPEIQGIVEAHGSKVIMPHRWTANTNVGSSYSTSYGDSKGVRYGLKSKPDLPAAVAIVETAYNTGRYKDCSFSQGAGYSYSTSESGQSGLLSRSQSYGNTESEFFADYTESYSNIGYSYNDSIIGNTDSFSTVTGKSFSQSVVGQSEGYSTIQKNSVNGSVINGDSISSQQVVGNSINYSDMGASKVYSTIENDSQNFSTVKGKSYSETTIGMPTGNSGNIWSNTFSGVANFQKSIGQSINTGLGWASAQLGLGGMNVSGSWISESKTTVNGNTKNTTTTLGDTYTDATTIGNSQSFANTFGNSTSTGFTAGLSTGLSTYVGLKADTSIFVGGRADVNITIGMLNTAALNLGMNNKLELAAAMNNSVSVNAALNNQINITAGINNILNINATIDNKTDLNLLEVKTKTTPLEVITEAANVKCRIGNIDVEIMTMKIFM